MNVTYNEYRCSNCQKLLFKGMLLESEIEIKCKRCHEFTTVKASKLMPFVCGKKVCRNRIPLNTT
ncbi:Com family DNA-binding transcriptional regulator [Candidatus Uhrbacteria bacterium]|nr:Com family DNA-binding transcriptional regulator [Candidatus Uhrbacteria bacterium]